MRGPQNAAQVWVMCPPFAEEEKSSRRLFTLISQNLAAQNRSSLVFSFRGTGDSEGDFARADLSAWKRDLGAAVTHSKTLFPQATTNLLGVRLGASLAWQEAERLGAARLILLEPLLSGRSFLMQQSAKKQIRAQLTGETAPTAADDLDGWELGQNLRNELSALDLKRDLPGFNGPITLFQIGPKTEIAPPLATLAASVEADTQLVAMPPFWNLIDAPDFSALLSALENEMKDE